MFSDCRTEWRIADVERKAEQAQSAVWKVDSLSSDVSRMESSLRDFISLVDGLRDQLQTCQDKIELLERRIETMEDSQ